MAATAEEQKRIESLEQQAEEQPAGSASFELAALRAEIAQREQAEAQNASTPEQEGGPVIITRDDELQDEDDGRRDKPDIGGGDERDTGPGSIEPGDEPTPPPAEPEIDEKGGETVSKAEQERLRRQAEREAEERRKAREEAEEKRTGPSADQLERQAEREREAAEKAEKAAEQREQTVQEYNESAAEYEADVEAAVARAEDEFASHERQIEILEKDREDLDLSDPEAVRSWNERREIIIASGQNLERFHNQVFDELDERAETLDQQLERVQGLDTEARQAFNEFDQVQSQFDRMLEDADLAADERERIERLQRAVAKAEEREAEVVADLEARNQARRRREVEEARERLATIANRELGEVEARERAMLRRNKELKALREAEDDAPKTRTVDTGDGAAADPGEDGVPGSTSESGDLATKVWIATRSGIENALEAVDDFDKESTKPKVTVGIPVPTGGGRAGTVEFEVDNPLNPLFKGLRAGAGLVADSILLTSPGIGAGIEAIDGGRTKPTFRTPAETITEPWRREKYEETVAELSKDIAEHERQSSRVAESYASEAAPVFEERERLNREAEALDRYSDRINRRDAADVERYNRLVEDWERRNEQVSKREEKLADEYDPKFSNLEKSVDKLSERAAETDAQAEALESTGAKLTNIIAPAGVASTALMVVPVGAGAGTVVRAGGKAFRLTAEGAKALAGKTLTLGQAATLRMRQAAVTAAREGISIAEAAAKAPAWALVTNVGEGGGRAIRNAAKTTTKKKPVRVAVKERPVIREVTDPRTGKPIIKGVKPEAPASRPGRSAGRGSTSRSRMAPAEKPATPSKPAGKSSTASRAARSNTDEAMMAGQRSASEVTPASTRRIMDIRRQRELARKSAGTSRGTKIQRTVDLDPAVRARIRPATVKSTRVKTKTSTKPATRPSPAAEPERSRGRRKTDDPERERVERESTRRQKSRPSESRPQDADTAKESRPKGRETARPAAGAGTAPVDAVSPGSRPTPRRGESPADVFARGVSTRPGNVFDTDLSTATTTGTKPGDQTGTDPARDPGSGRTEDPDPGLTPTPSPGPSPAPKPPGGSPTPTPPPPAGKTPKPRQPSERIRKPRRPVRVSIPEGGTARVKLKRGEYIETATIRQGITESGRDMIARRTEHGADLSPAVTNNIRANPLDTVVVTVGSEKPEPVVQEIDYGPIDLRINAKRGTLRHVRDEDFVNRRKAAPRARKTAAKKGKAKGRKR